MNVYAITNAQGETYNTYDVNKKLKDLGIPDEIIEQGEDAIENYAQENSITLPTSDEQEQKETPEVKGAGDTAKQDYETQLEALGVPKETIAKGDDAVQQFAEANNINLPASSTGTKFNLMS